jgi:oral-facial-digital syndrome 1 protein
LQYKSEIYSKFKDIGLLDNLKAQMRYKLLEKLQVPQTKPSSDSSESPLLLKIINSLISDHMRLKNYNYSYSVFLPETGQDTLKREEIIDILNINKSQILNKGLLEQLIETFMLKRPKSMEKMNMSTQTETYDNIIGLESRLNNVDDEYKKRIGSLDASIPKTLEEKFFNYKKDLEKRQKLEMQAEVKKKSIKIFLFYNS